VTVLAVGVDPGPAALGPPDGSLAVQPVGSLAAGRRPEPAAGGAPAD
jgi:hypothetical protein